MKKGAFKRDLTRRFGKVVDTSEIWIDDRTYPTELRLMKEKSSFGGNEHFSYSLIHIIEEGTDDKRYGVIDDVQGGDVNELKDELEKKILKRYDVTWTDMICVCVKAPTMSRSDINEGASLAITLLRYQSGERRFDGSKCYRKMTYRERFHDEEAGWRADGRIEEKESPAEKPNHFDRDRRFGIMPYTDEAWDKLNAIVNAIEMLRDQATEILTGDNLAERLLEMTMPASLLLEGPAPNDEGFD
jgi:hypothetical protein